MGFLKKFKEVFTGKEEADSYLSGFKKTRDSLANRALELRLNFKEVDDAFLEELMIVLLESDIGYETAEKIIDKLRKYNEEFFIENFNTVVEFIVESMEDIYGDKEDYFSFMNEDGVKVILLVGVNGSGKTTSCAKLMHRYKNDGYKVAAVAADTFRAGAIEQLARWGESLDIPVIKGRENGDPSAAIVDGCRFAKENDIDILLVDTAGRLQSKKNLMIELEKMHRVIKKEIPEGPHAVWLVIDSTTGQNGLSQASVFLESTNVTGVILSKMDGTAKGGIVIGIKDTLNIPVVYVGFGEKPDELMEFDIDGFVYSIAMGLEND